ncbi:O-antigen ligase domain-containing protein [Chlorogloeopsis sp. ULAP01]|uniref:O-antigen ligase domain-containing protein n=1 Tax=Chlorogloeopsis sp. ULAP01 TaxID=3056483 RepID=UPI0025AA5ADF|nr:O-antigen ligase domain-containing protein [Chlorogloeopsis sp. ULAP01]MDM9381028.1 O-antigen ligase domain-containing protein [Chlorogloeopsis sp. ULAP01]
MIHRQVTFNNSFAESAPENPPLFGWLAILGLVLFSVACIAVGAGSIFRPGYVVVSFAVGIFLYLRYPTLYMGFLWWIWFLTPLVARLIDYRTSFDSTRFILVSQYLVTLITMHTALKNLPRSYRQGGLPFILAFLGVLYGYLIGLVKTTPFTAARGLLDWLTPISFAFYIFITWQNYPRHRQNIVRTFLWGVLVTGIYGVVQFLIAPEWDRFWLIGTKLTSFGDPEPFGIRVWSTMASPGPFATTMMAGLLLLFNSKDVLRIPASAVGYLSFLLTMVRSIWGAWLVGLLSLLSSLKPKIQMRLMVTILVMAVCVVPLANMEPFSGVISKRLETFSNLEKDNSAQIRQEIYKDGLTKALTNGLGNGIGNTFIVNEKGLLEPIVIDSGILDMFFTLGWFGAVFYLGGLILLLFQVFQYFETRVDPFMAAARAIGIACVASLPIGSGMLGVSGMILWGFLAIVMAGHKYYVHQNYVQQRNSRFH